MISEYEFVLIDLRKQLSLKNIRRVYRILNLKMPEELERHLRQTGCILWEEFTISAINRYDINSTTSNVLGTFETGLTILPPVKSIIKYKKDQESGNSKY